MLWWWRDGLGGPFRRSWDYCPDANAIPLDVLVNLVCAVPQPFADTRRDEFAPSRQAIDRLSADAEQRGDVVDRKKTSDELSTLCLMLLHVPRVDAAGRPLTSAEPDFAAGEPNHWPPDELDTCKHAVLADRRPDLFGDGVTLFRDGVDRFFPAPSLEKVLEDAPVVMATVQQRLRVAGGAGAVLDLRYGRVLWDANWQAHAAVVAKACAKRANEIRDEVAVEGPPLSICVGQRARRFGLKMKDGGEWRFPEHEQILRVNAPDIVDDPDHPGYVPYVSLGYGDGCGVIIVDTPLPRSLQRMPKRYCDRCAKRAGNNPKTAGLAKHALAKLRAARKA